MPYLTDSAGNVIIDSDSSNVYTGTTLLRSFREVSLSEGESEVGTLSAVTDDPSPSISFAKTGSGADQALFTFVGNLLKFIVEPDFEDPDDANQDGTYLVEVIATDANSNGIGPATDTQMLAISVGDIIGDDVVEPSMVRSRVQSRVRSRVRSLLDHYLN